jgi:hypothetical protein
MDGQKQEDLWRTDTFDYCLENSIQTRATLAFIQNEKEMGWSIQNLGPTFQMMSMALLV